MELEERIGYRYMACRVCGKVYNVSRYCKVDPAVYVCPVCDRYMPPKKKKRKRNR